ncbi:MAG: hypothetical protein ACQKBW_13670 [Puniceicoccales bacterium]
MLIGLVLPCVAFSQAPQQPLLSVGFRTYFWRVVSSKPPVVADNDAVLPDYVAPTVGYLDPERGFTDMKVAEGQISPRYRYRGPNPITFVSGEGGEVLGTVSLDPSMHQALLIFFPGGKNGESYRILPIEVSPEKINRGQALVINLCQDPVAVEMGSNQMLLNRGQSQSIRLSDAKNRRLPVRLAIKNDDGKWKKKIDEDLIIDPKGRLIFLLHEPRNNQFRIVTLNADI